MCLLLLTLPLTLFLLAFSFWTVHTVRDQFAQRSIAVLSVLQNTIEMEMDDAESAIATIALDSSDFRNLAEEYNGTKAYLQAYEIQENYLRLLMDSNHHLTASFVYSGGTDRMTELWQEGNLPAAAQIERRKVLESAVRSLWEDGTCVTDRWFVLSTETGDYLCRAAQKGKALCVAAMELGSLSEQEDGGRLLFCENGTVLPTQAEADALGGLKWKTGEMAYSSVRLNGTEMLSIETAFHTVEVLYLVPYESELRTMSLWQMLLIVFTVCEIIALPIALWGEYNLLVKPLKQLEQVMLWVAEGDLKAAEGVQFRSSELQQVQRTLTHMIEQVTTLQYAAYEQKIQNQKLQLQALRLQIRPHFYLNCLKNIYALAETNRGPDIQKAILYLSEHLRYVFSGNADTVTLDTELQHCVNYANLQNLNNPGRVAIELDADPGLMQLGIPPISLLSFVENSIKYGMTLEQKLQLTISARRLAAEDESFAVLTVRDDGPGFAEEQLDQYNSIDPQEIGTPAQHVGILNTLCRFFMVYGESFAFAFSNNPGACIELYLPIKEGEETTHGGLETSDR